MMSLGVDVASVLGWIMVGFWIGFCIGSYLSEKRAMKDLEGLARRVDAIERRRRRERHGIEADQ